MTTALLVISDCEPPAFCSGVVVRDPGGKGVVRIWPGGDAAVWSYPPRRSILSLSDRGATVIREHWCTVEASPCSASCVRAGSSAA